MPNELNSGRSLIQSAIVRTSASGAKRTALRRASTALPTVRRMQRKSNSAAIKLIRLAIIATTRSDMQNRNMLSRHARAQRNGAMIILGHTTRTARNGARKIQRQLRPLRGLGPSIDAQEKSQPARSPLQTSALSEAQRHAQPAEGSAPAWRSTTSLLLAEAARIIVLTFSCSVAHVTAPSTPRTRLHGLNRTVVFSNSLYSF